MAYAKLVFSGSATVQQKLKEIANVCTGGITSTSQLQFANATQSIIVNTEAAGWSIVDANSALESGSTATKNQYRLSAPCVNTNKTKYCELSALASVTISTPTGGNTAVFNTRPGANATTGYLWIPIGSSVSANTLVNPVWFYNAGGTLNGGFNPTAYSPYLSTSTTEYHISVTNRKLIVFGVGGFQSIIMNLEFPENIQTSTNDNLPFININLSLPATANVGTIMLPNYISTVTNSQSPILYRNAWLTNWYDITTKTRSTVNAGGFLDPYYISVAPSQTVTSAGTTVYPLLEFVDVRTSKGEGIHNYSTLTDTYYTFRTSVYNAIGDEITVGADTYVVLSIGPTSAGAGNRAICVKKA